MPSATAATAPSSARQREPLWGQLREDPAILSAQRDKCRAAVNRLTGNEDLADDLHVA
jgi:hypothetical protein